MMFESLWSANTFLAAVIKNMCTLLLSVMFLDVFVNISHEMITSFEIGAISGLCRIFITLLTLRGKKFSYLEFFAIPLGAIVASVFHMHIVPGASMFGIVEPDDIANWFLWGQLSVWVFGFFVDGLSGFKKADKNDD